MFAKADWFTRRKYSGWGLTPKTWQGWSYIAFVVICGFIIQSLPMGETPKLIFSAVLIIFFVVDILVAMASIKLDEREAKIENIAERNASWSMVGACALSLLYVNTLGTGIVGVEFMPILVFIMLCGLAAKALTNFLLRNKTI